MAQILIHVRKTETETQLRDVLMSNGHAAVIQDPSKGSLEQVIHRFAVVVFEFEDPRFEACLHCAAEACAAVIVLVDAEHVGTCARRLQSQLGDYIVRPFRVEELIARVDATVRIREVNHIDVLSVSDVKLIPAKHQVFKRGNLVELAPREYALLLFLMQNPGVVFARERLIECIWGNAGAAALHDGTRTVDMHVRRLRSKLGLEDVIITVQKMGYRLDGSLHKQMEGGAWENGGQQHDANNCIAIQQKYID